MIYSKNIPAKSRWLGNSLVITFPWSKVFRVVLHGERAKRYARHFSGSVPYALLDEASIVEANWDELRASDFTNLDRPIDTSTRRD